MRIAVMGAGALGGYFGGRLLAAGSDVAFVARGAQLEALRRDGLTIESPLGDLRLASVVATDDPAEIGPVDIVMFLVKLYDSEAAAAVIRPLVTADTVVVSFQNGVDARARVGGVVGDAHVAGGVALISADVRAPGVIRHNSDFARLVFGAFEGPTPPLLARFKDRCDAADVAAELVDDIERRIWEKFVFLSTFSAITALTRLPIGPILADPMCRRLYREALDEATAVARRRHPEIAADFADRHIAFAGRMGWNVHASMLDDLTRGKRLELMHLSGRVVALGEELGIATPVHATVTRALHPFADGPPSVAAPGG